MKWPNNDEKQEIMSNFEDISGFTGVIGAIDGTQIYPHSPPPPGKKGANYVNRKSFHSIILQAGWPGRVNDARVFRNSKVCQCQAQLCGPGPGCSKLWLALTTG